MGIKESNCSFFVPKIRYCFFGVLLSVENHRLTLARVRFLGLAHVGENVFCLLRSAFLCFQLDNV